MSKKLSMGNYNFLKYCYGVTYTGKKVLIHVLDWYYKGGDKNYLDYLMSEYGVDEIKEIIDCESLEHMRNQRLYMVALPVIHTIMELVCSIYDDADKKEYQIGALGVPFLLKCIERLVIVHVNLGTLKPSLTESQLRNKFDELNDLFEKILYVGHKNLKGSLEMKEPNIYVSIELELVCLQDDLTKVKYSDPSELDSMLQMRRVVYNLVDLTELPKKIDADTAFEFLEEHRRIPKRLKSKGDSMEKEVKEPCDFGLRTLLAINALAQLPELSIRVTPTLDEECREDSEGKRDGKGYFFKSSQTSQGINRRISMQDIIDALLIPILRQKDDEEYNDLDIRSYNLLETMTNRTIPLEFHQKYVTTPRKPIKFEDLLNCMGSTERDKTEIIILSGEAGTGKSHLMKFICDMWKNEYGNITGLDEYSVLLYIDLENNRYNWFCQWLLDHVNERVRGTHNIKAEKILKTILKEEIVLLILDGYDESKESSNLVKDVMELKGTHFKIIFTCRPQHVDALTCQIPKNRKKNLYHLVLSGITYDWHSDCLRGMIVNELDGEAHSSSSKKEKKDLRECFLKKLPQMYSILGNDLNNPMLMSILTKMWLENPSIQVE